MSEDPIAETAKATQEVAKTTSEAIKATKALGVYVANLVKEPVDTIVGILTDKLKYIRWERQLRLLDRVKEKVKQRNLEGKLVPIPPKLALPIIENATLEEDDYLQDLWANLLIEAGNPQSKERIRTAFIEIIKQLEPIDAKILEESYKFVISIVKPYGDKINIIAFLPRISISKSKIINFPQLTLVDYITSLDNLMRLRCLKSYVVGANIDVPDYSKVLDTYKPNMRLKKYDISKDYQYEQFCLTVLGYNFVKVCIIPE